MPSVPAKKLSQQPTRSPLPAGTTFPVLLTPQAEANPALRNPRADAQAVGELVGPYVKGSPNASRAAAVHIVRVARNTDRPTGDTTSPTLDTLAATPGLLGLGHRAIVLEPSLHEYVVQYAPAGFACWRDGNNVDTSNGEFVDAGNGLSYVPRGTYTAAATYQQYDSVAYNGATYYRAATGNYTAPTLFDPAAWVGFGAGLYTTIDYANERVVGVNYTAAGTASGAYSITGLGGKSYVLNGHTVELASTISIPDGSVFYGRLFAFRAIGTAASTVGFIATGQGSIDGASSLTLAPGEWAVLKSDFAAGGYTKVMRGSLGAPYTTANDIEITDPAKGIIMTVGSTRVRAQISGTAGARTWTFTDL